MKSDPKTTHPPETAFQEYLDGEMTAEAAYSFESHLSACKPCTAELAFWQKTFNQIESLPNLALTKDLSRQVIRELEAGADTGNVLYMILAEAALGTTLAVVFWPFISGWLESTGVNFITSVQTFFNQFAVGLSNLLAPLDFLHQEGINFSLESYAPLSETFLVPTIIAGLALLFLGNGIVIKSTQSDRQRRR